MGQEETYEPYSLEWKQELMEVDKEDLISWYRDALIKLEHAKTKVLKVDLSDEDLNELKERIEASGAGNFQTLQIHHSPAYIELNGDSYHQDLFDAVYEGIDVTLLPGEMSDLFMALKKHGLKIIKTGEKEND